MAKGRLFLLLYLHHRTASIVRPEDRKIERDDDGYRQWSQKKCGDGHTRKIGDTQRQNPPSGQIQKLNVSTG